MTTPKVFAKRWRTSEGQALRASVMEHLVDSSRPLPEGFGTVGGRADLRGLFVDDLALRPLSARNNSAMSAQPSDLVRLDGVHWKSLDLSHARLPSMRFLRATLQDCLFEGAWCNDWRLWNSEVLSSSFRGASLRDSAIGTWEDERSNRWIGVAFDGADLRGASAQGCAIVDCSFREVQLNGVSFEQVDMQGCVFEGVIESVTFESRELPRRPKPSVMSNVDFGAAVFRDVEFRGCRFNNVTLPKTEGMLLIHRYNEAASKALSVLAGDTSLNAKMLVAQITASLKMPGPDDAVGVYNRRDYVDSADDTLADLAELAFFGDAQG